MSNRTLKILLLFLTIFAIQTVLLLVLLLRPQVSSAAIGVRADGKDYATCPCGFKKEGDAEKETIRLFIPIPGVTDGCGYLCDINGDSKGDVVDYVVAIYKFLVGAAAIMAVIMIMIGGYQWIFAMGSASAIESAKDTIKSALFGLLLTLFSYQVLHFINPRLTDVVLPEVEEIGRMQIGGYLCGGDDVLVDDEGFNSVLVGSFVEAIKDGKKLAKTNFYLQSTYRQGSGYGASSPPFTIDEKKLISGLHPASATATTDILKCDNEAKSYKVPTIQGDPKATMKNPSGPEVKIAHFNTTTAIDETTDKEKTTLIGIDCFYSLCDTNPNTSLVDTGVAQDNIKTLKAKAADYATANNYAIANEVEIYNSVSTRVEPRGGGCYGSFCDPAGEGLTLCLSRSGMGIGCWNISQMCKDTDKNMCEETDQMLQSSIADAMKTGVGGLPVACGKRLDQEMNPDQCVLGIKFGCPIGYPQIDPLTSYAKETDINLDACWREDTKKKEKKKLDCWKSAVANYEVFPVDSGFAVDKISAVCCEERQNVPGENYGKLQGICVESFDAAYSTQTFKALKEICVARLDQNDPLCKVLTTSTYITQWDGNCELQTGFINGQLQKASVCMLPHDKEKKPTTKVCHLGKDHVMYANVEACATRNTKQDSWAFELNWRQWQWIPFLIKNKVVINCESYILPYNYPCLDLPAAGSFGGEKSGGGGGGGGAGDIKGTIDTLKAEGGKIEKILEDIVDIPDDKPGGLTDLKSKLSGQTFGLLDSEPSLPINSALAAKSIDACKFVEAIIAQESGGKQDLCPKNDNGTWDCGLMQVNVNNCNDQLCKSVNDNITAGVAELVKLFNDSLYPNKPCGDDEDTTCNRAKDSKSDKLYRYVLSAYNGGPGANADAADCSTCGNINSDCAAAGTSCCSGTCKNKCFLEGMDDALVTKVECPINSGGCDPKKFEYCSVTYPYVMEKFDKNYKELDDYPDNTPGVASCP